MLKNRLATAALLQNFNPDPAALSYPQRRTNTTLPMPNGEHPDLGGERNVVDVIATCLQHDATSPRYGRLSI